MTGWLKLTDDQRRATLAQAQQRSGIIVKAIEKDWWVTLVLKALFQSAYASHMVFKGGTSLSKGYKLINRFSEDIDIALASEAFDMTYEQNPTTSYLKRLRKKGMNSVLQNLWTNCKNNYWNLECLNHSSLLRRNQVLKIRRHWIHKRSL